MATALHHHRFPALGGWGEVVLAGCDAPSAAAWSHAAESEVRRIEHKYSRYRSDGVIAQINAQAGGEPVEVDAETQQLLRFADTLHVDSEGLFDPTAGVLRRAWDFRTPRLPEAAELAPLLALIGWQRVERSDTHLRLPMAGMELDFGGFGKEYAADRAAVLLQAQGARSGYVNLAGDLRLLGPKPDGSPWQIGIQHPRQPGAMVATLALQQGGLATSGDYERYFDLDGRRYCHVLNPKTGWPVQHWQSISVQAPQAVAAGAVSTLAMLFEARALDFLNSTGLPYLALDARGQAFTSTPS